MGAHWQPKRTPLEAELIRAHQERRARREAQAVKPSPSESPAQAQPEPEVVIEPPTSSSPLLVAIPRDGVDRNKLYWQAHWAAISCLKDRVKPVVRAVCEHYDVGAHQLLGLDRRAHVSHVRLVAMYLAWCQTGMAIAEIGRQFRRDHTCMLHARRRIRGQLRGDPATREEIAAITKRAAELKGCGDA